MPPQQFISSDGGIVEMGAEVGGAHMLTLFLKLNVCMLLAWIGKVTQPSGYGQIVNGCTLSTSSLHATKKRTTKYKHLKRNSLGPNNSFFDAILSPLRFTIMSILLTMTMMTLVSPVTVVQVYYVITDVETMVREVADHQDMLRSLSE